MTIIPIYAALLALIYAWQSVRIIAMRRRYRINLGDGGNTLLLRAIAGHNNFSQYVPFALLLLAFMELQQQSPLLLHIFALCLLVGRILHALAFASEKGNAILRTGGMVLTIASIVLTAVALLYRAVVLATI